MNKFLLRDSSGKTSVTFTAFVLGFLTCNFKLLVGGMVFEGYAMSPFSGVDYGACLAALGGIYVLRRKTDNVKYRAEEETNPVLGE